jgi:predicted flap endonuclease-1-like 5' DNA nuclease
MKIEELEGIGPTYATKLTNIGITTVETFLQKGATATGRHDIATTTGINETVIRNLINAADLMRVNGIGKQFAELLEASGVDSVPELATRTPDNLLAKLTEVNATKKLANRTPTLAVIQQWVEEAKTLPTIVTH